MHFDFDDWAKEATSGIRKPRPMADIAEDSAWLWLEQVPWVPTPELFFAMKELILDQMKGG